jgi:hypothetical protein
LILQNFMSFTYNFAYFSYTLDFHFIKFIVLCLMHFLITIKILGGNNFLCAYIDSTIYLR